jgi:hypothetical protein
MKHVDELAREQDPALDWIERRDVQRVRLLGDNALCTAAHGLWH